MNSLQILLAPTYALARTVTAEATVEAEYGHECVEGTRITLAHHDCRSDNTAPCNTDIEPDPSVHTVLVSHLDLDAVGGIMAIEGTKPEDPEFWEGAEFIDVNGIHHIQELSHNVQDKLKAYYALEEDAKAKFPLLPRDQISDVTDRYQYFRNAITTILDKDRSQEMIQKGKKWYEMTAAEIEKRLIWENENIRAFVTDGVFCSAGYYSPSQGKVIPSTVVLNIKTNGITVAMADGGKKIDTKDIVQKLWGLEAGGHAGIAGSPRGQVMTCEDLQDAVSMLDKAFAELK